MGAGRKQARADGKRRNGRSLNIRPRVFHAARGGWMRANSIGGTGKRGLPDDDCDESFTSSLPAVYALSSSSAGFMDKLGNMKKKGLFRTNEPGVGECAYTHRSAGEGFPFLPRDIYEALQFQPSFDALPTKEAYEQHHRASSWRYGSPMWRRDHAST